jgi:NADPH-dependent 2,4-dienoyl-CoA reductase/sulfur reductase-like enzyme
MSSYGKERLVIIGGGAAGLSAASRARRVKPSLDITIIEKSNEIGAALCSLPLVMEGRIPPEKAFVKPISYFTKDLGINIMSGREALSIERNPHLVIAVSPANGETVKVPFDKLILALGTKPVLPDIKNFSNKNNVFSIRSLDETLRLLKFIEDYKSRRAAIIGCGIHGVSIAYALRKRGIDVVIIESKQNPFEQFIEDIRKFILEEVYASGIKLMAGCRVFEVSGKDYAESLSTDNGVINADIILPASGFIPSTEIAQDAGIACTEDGFIALDDFQLTSDFDIFACGDCATVKCITTGKRINHSSAALASRTGYFAGQNAAGFRKPFKGTTRTSLVKLGDYHFGSAGLNSKQARQEGYDIIESTVTAPVKPPNLSEEMMTVHLVFNRKNSRLLGAQVGGCCAVRSELDLVSLALQNNMGIDDLAFSELSYNPQSFNILHPIHYAARKALRDI